MDTKNTFIRKLEEALGETNWFWATDLSGIEYYIKASNADAAERKLGEYFGQQLGVGEEDRNKMTGINKLEPIRQGGYLNSGRGGSDTIILP